MLDTAFPRVLSGLPRPSRILTPRDLAGHQGRERQTVPGGGAWLLQLRQGDQITLINDEGGQPAELIATHENGRIDAGILGHAANSDGAGLKSMLALPFAPGLARLRAGLAKRGIDLSHAGAIRLWGANTPARSNQSFTAGSPGWLIVAAPGLPMAPDDQNTATPITVEIQRAAPRAVGKYDLPDPLADPILDLRVRNATAESYFVKAGDYIRSLMSMAANARIFNALTRASLTGAFKPPSM